MHIKSYTPALLAVGAFLMAGTLSWANQTDPQLESSIRSSYIFTNYLKDDSINVHSQGGVVTLTGTVADEDQKNMAQDTAANFADVKSVNNQLQVKNSMPAMYSDGWIGVKVKTALLFHRNVSAVSTHVDVKDGIVTLSGDADNEAQRELTGQYAQGVDGVKGVVNEIVIKQMPNNNSGEKMGQTIDDASITVQVKMALLMNRSTSAISTHVRTDKGVVTLSGKAQNDAEKSLATKLVNDINGVKQVINHMDVQS